MKKIVLLRHGESVWNRENRFTGWTDVDLSEKGVAEAVKAGETLRKEGFHFGRAYTSYLKRAVKTLDVVLDRMDRDWIPVTKTWRLNEKHYGMLQGLNKRDTAEKYGDEQVYVWRRSYDVQPPALTADDPRFPGHDPRYALLSSEELPLTESLRDTIARVRPCWEELIVPQLQLRDTVLVAAHGNSLRALVMMLLHLTPDEVMKTEIPTGAPWVFDLGDRLELLANRYL